MERANTISVSGARSVSLPERLAMVRRRAVPALVTAAAVFLIAVVAAFVWPAKYRSTGTILIEQQEVPVDLVRSTISSYADQRIQVITQRVMTSENLMRIIDRYGLYADRRRRETREAIIERMRDDIDFRMISADVVDPRLGRPTKATIAFSVSYDNRSPQLAAKVANELTTLYLNENIESRTQTADDTATFLTSEANRLSAQITELEAKRAAFKTQHAGSLPELEPINLQLMERTAEELRETDARIRSLDQQIVYLEAQLAQLTPAAQIYTSTGERVMSPADRLKVLKSEYSRAKAIYAADHPDVVRMKREIEGLQREVGDVETGTDLARQLSEARSQLAEVRKRYAPDHPDVLQLERLVSSIELAMKAAPLTANVTEEGADNPAYIQVRAQREAAVNERASLQGKRDALKNRISDFENRLSSAPEVEREYSAILRDLDNAQLKYRETRQKQMEATLSRNLETERKGERFTLIEPPLVAEEPFSPDRLVIVLLGSVFAIGGAVGVVAALETLDGSVRSRRDLMELLTVPPLAIVPWVVTEHERALHGKRKRFAMVGAMTSVLLAVVAIHLFYKPLDVLWHVALRKLGV